MNSDITLNKEFQKVTDVLKGYTDIFSGISEPFSASPQLTEAFKKAAGLHSFAFPDEFIEQMKKITAPLMKIAETGGIVPSGGGSLPTYEINYDSFEPQPIRIKIVIDND